MKVEQWVLNAHLNTPCASSFLTYHMITIKDNSEVSSPMLAHTLSSSIHHQFQQCIDIVIFTNGVLLCTLTIVVVV
jgi:hypothetical protein